MLIDEFFWSANLAKLTNLEVEINFKNYLQNIQKQKTKNASWRVNKTAKAAPKNKMLQGFVLLFAATGLLFQFKLWQLFQRPLKERKRPQRLQI